MRTDIHLVFRDVSYFNTLSNYFQPLLFDNTERMLNRWHISQSVLGNVAIMYTISVHDHSCS
jgi:hypothetical protein